MNDTLSFNSISDNSVRVIKKINDSEYLIGTNNGLNSLNPKTGKINRIGSLTNRVYPEQLYQIALELNEKGAMKNLTKVKDDQDLTLEFTVIKPRKYFIFASGEGLLADKRLYDYGWIENLNGDTLWSSIKFIKTFSFGGAAKNRAVFDIIELKPGKYKLRYFSDDSHSYQEWNAEPPRYPELWGISIAELDNERLIGSIENHLTESNENDLIEGNNIRSIHLQDDIIWIGTDQFGLNKIDRKNNSVKTYSYDEKNHNSLSNNSIHFILKNT